MRLNRFLASAGFGSRRGVEEMVVKGRVQVNGKFVTELATKVEPGDSVKVDGKLVQSEKVIHAVIYKPRGYLCTARDPEERKTIFHLLPRDWPRVFNVGRLDKDSEGLLLITNDGDLSMRLTHPRFKVDKHYEVLLDKSFDLTLREKLLRGFHIEGGRAKCESVEVLSKPNHLGLVLRQGIKRQIRLMMYELGYEVERLIRVRVGPISLGDLGPGNWRPLNSREVEQLRSSATEQNIPDKTGRNVSGKSAPVGPRKPARKFPQRTDRNDPRKGPRAAPRKAPGR